VSMGRTEVQVEEQYMSMQTEMDSGRSAGGRYM
jgi:hypothetical protein